MSTVKNAVIAAAGLGSRLGHGLPKCMLEINGKTLLSRLINSLEKYVENIHVVVGYREDLVINHCANHHRNVVIVRNADYRTTNTIDSMQLGSRGLIGKTIYLDGDLIINEKSLLNFLSKAKGKNLLAAFTTSRSENSINVDIDNYGNDFFIKKFTKDKSYLYEWANVVVANEKSFNGASGYVYEKLEESLPLSAAFLELREIDTAKDLEEAILFVNDNEKKR